MKLSIPVLIISALAGVGLGANEVACTQQQVKDATKIATEIACAIEHAELDDPEIDKICGLLTDAQRLALNTHRQKLVAAKVVVVQAKCDGGAGAK